MSNSRSLRLWRWLFLRADRRDVLGITVGLLWPFKAEAASVWPKIEQGLALFAQTDPRRFARLRADVDGIMVFGTVGAWAEWRKDSRLVVVQMTYAAAPATSVASLASTLVHEGTHAWLDRLGFGYEAKRRQRIEAICFRSEAAFARRLPDPGDLIEITERQLARSSDFWTNESFRQRNLSELRQLGLPNWCVKILQRISRRRTA